MRALRGLTATEIQPRQLVLQWEPLGYNLTRCHTYSLSLCYRYSMPTGSSGGNNATVRECLSVDRNTSHFTLRDLPPFRTVHVRLALSNPEGKKESREITFQTEEDSEWEFDFTWWSLTNDNHPSSRQGCLCMRLYCHGCLASKLPIFVVLSSCANNYSAMLHKVQAFSRPVLQK